MVTVLLKGVKNLILEFELRESKEAKHLQNSSIYRVCGVKRESQLGSRPRSKSELPQRKESGQLEEKEIKPRRVIGALCKRGHSQSAVSRYSSNSLTVLHLKITPLS